jgi:hypothetical protein
LQDTVSKIPSQKRAGGVAQGVAPECKPQYHERERERVLFGLTVLEGPVHNQLAQLLMDQ